MHPRNVFVVSVYCGLFLQSDQFPLTWDALKLICVKKSLFTYAERGFTTLKLLNHPNTCNKLKVMFKRDTP